MTSQLNEASQTTFNASGDGTASLGPNGYETWNVSTIAVFVNSNTAEPTARIYLGSVSPQNFIGGTYTGSTDSSDQSVTVLPNQNIICVWTGGDPGAQGTLSLYGTKEP